MGTSNIKPVFDGAVNKGTEGEKPDPNAPPAEGDKKEEDPEDLLVKKWAPFFKGIFKIKEVRPELEKTFLKEKQGNLFAYYLGTLPLLQMSFNTEHNRVIFSGGTHACIYPQTFIKHTAENVNQETVTDWDSYMNHNYTRYKYHTPLCYQLFPQTENQTNWGHENPIFRYISKIAIELLKIMKLDTNIYPGYDIFEFTSKFIFWFIVFTLIIVNVVVNYFTYKNFKWLKKNWHYFIYLFIGNNVLYPISILCIFALVVYIQTLLYV